jgi:hypothetical protein
MWLPIRVPALFHTNELLDSQVTLPCRSYLHTDLNKMREIHGRELSDDVGYVMKSLPQYQAAFQAYIAKQPAPDQPFLVSIKQEYDTAIDYLEQNFSPFGPG